MVNIRIPRWVWTSGAILIALFVAFKLGQKDIRDDWRESREKGKKIVDELREKANTVTTKIEKQIEYRDRTIYVQGKERERIKEVFVPFDSGFLSGGFRLYHDAAATNAIPDPTQIPNAAPTAVTDVASTIDTNYQLCHKAYARVEEWQNWAREQQRISKQAIADSKVK